MKKKINAPTEQWKDVIIPITEDGVSGAFATMTNVEDCNNNRNNRKTQGSSANDRVLYLQEFDKNYNICKKKI